MLSKGRSAGRQAGKAAWASSFRSGCSAKTTGLGAFGQGVLVSVNKDEEPEAENSFTMPCCGWAMQGILNVNICKRTRSFEPGVWLVRDLDAAYMHRDRHGPGLPTTHSGLALPILLPQFLFSWQENPDSTPPGASRPKKFKCISTSSLSCRRNKLLPLGRWGDLYYVGEEK